MIVLPTSPAIAQAMPHEIDFGFIQRPSTGAGATKIDRPGLRLGAEFSLPSMPADAARIFVNRLLRAKSEGLRVPWPLMDISQGAPGNPVVNGSGASGTSLPVRGATPGYQVKEGWWLNVVDGAGVYYLHGVAADVTLASGSGTITVWPPLRADLSDGDNVVLDAPKMEGLVTSETKWPVTTDHNVALSFTLEEIQ